MSSIVAKIESHPCDFPNRGCLNTVSATHNAFRELGRRVSSGSDERESAVLLNASAKCTGFSHTVRFSFERLPYNSWCRTAVQNNAHSPGQTRRGWSDFPALTFPRTRVTRSSFIIPPFTKSRDAIVAKDRWGIAKCTIVLNRLRSSEQHQHYCLFNYSSAHLPRVLRNTHGIKVTLNNF